jgi:predicted aspartyl protease
VSFREVAGRGLLVRTWVNGVGPFNFAIDTGAGATLISSRVAAEAHVTSANDRPTSISGLTGTRTTAYHTSLENLAIGEIENYLPNKGEVLITSGLPADLDGVLDPTEALAPLGYTIDIPGREFTAFDPRSEALQVNRPPVEGAVVSWLREAHGRRPFVMLDNGDRALIDTGSSLGLAIRDPNAASRSVATGARDVGGGRISTRRVSTSTIAIGSLMLRRIPTDLVSGAEADAPVLLGLTALRPFRLRFDPLHRLIEIGPNAVSRGN